MLELQDLLPYGNLILIICRFYWIASSGAIIVLAICSSSKTLSQIKLIQQVLSWGKLNDPALYESTESSSSNTTSTNATKRSQKTEGRAEGNKSGDSLQSNSFASYFRVPKRLFKHFYTIGSVWNASIIAVVLSRYTLSDLVKLFSSSPASSTDTSITTCLFNALSSLSLSSSSSSLSSVSSSVASSSSLGLGGIGSCFSSFNLLSYNSNDVTYETDVLIALFCLQFQLLRRTYECYFVSVFSDGTMHVVHYLVGLSFYIFVPLSIVSNSDLLFSSSLSSSLSTSSTSSSTSSTSSSDSPTAAVSLVLYQVFQNLTWRHWLGLELFFFASLHQYRCHAILAGLRTSKNTSNGYFLPNGDWFNKLGSPHYFAEILIYTAFVWLQRGTLNSILTVLFVFANLSLGAKLADKWYRLKFPGYDRYILIPYVW